MKHINTHTPIPRYGQQGINLAGGVIEYKLTDVELAYARAGSMDKVPTAAQRGLTAPPKEPETLRIPREHRYVGKGRKSQNKERITLEVLQQAKAAGKTQAELALEFDVTPTTISTMAKKHGFIWEPKKTKHRGKRP